MPHQRRRSGALLSPTDSRKAVTVSEYTKSTTSRPAAMPRRFTNRAPKSPRSRQDSWDSEDESFPQFCMTCEKQFVPHDDKFLYCSESCRRCDQHSSPSPASTAAVPTFNTSHEFFFHDEPRDIIPQASPSRPSSTLFATSPPSSPHENYNYHHESAVSALRSSLSGSSGRPPSPQSLSANYWPFGRGSGANGDSSSYYKTSSTYDAAYYGADRPLPSRQPIGYRSKSIELVTPIMTR